MEGYDFDDVLYEYAKEARYWTKRGGRIQYQGKKIEMLVKNVDEERLAKWKKSLLKDNILLELETDKEGRSYLSMRRWHPSIPPETKKAT
jgi:hypothetical protein